MLTDYTNQDELLKSTSVQRVSRLKSVDKELLDVRYFAAVLNKSFTPNLEIHVYTPEGIYLTGNHKSLYSIVNNDTTSQKVANQHISIDTVKELDSLGIKRGQYRLVYNLFDNVLGSFDTQKAFIKEISPSRKELKIQLSNIENNSNNSLKNQLSLLALRWNSLSTENNYFDSFVLNFGFNETYQIINFNFNADKLIPEIFVKLYEPLPAKYVEKTKVWISEEIINPEMELISIIPKFVPETTNTLAPANFNLELYEGNSIATDYKSWNDLLANNVQTSQQLIDTYFSGSLSGIKLNINYRDFSNFVHYGSAVERVKNFKYKLNLIEHFTSQISIIESAPSSNILTSSILDIQTKKNTVVSGFDDFEKYLFFQSAGEKLYTHFDSASGSIDPWPKIVLTDFTWLEGYQQWQSASNPWSVTYFTNINPTTDAVSIAYYQDLLEQAEIYDKFNTYKLKDTIPTHIQNSDNNEEFMLFVNMIAQHFDIIWTYINNLTSTKTREEHPKDGMPNDLLYHVASSMGFNLLNGNSAKELWRYALGVDSDGIAAQDATVTGIASLSNNNITKEIWRRIVNNLPYILKSKGTSRSVKALLTCFGIPSTVLTIKEYGGPSTFTDEDHFPEYVHDVYHKAWNANGLTTLTLPNAIIADTLEFRFKTDNNYTYEYGIDYTIFTAGAATKLDLTRENNYTNLGKITYDDGYGTIIEVGNLEIFDNSWHLITIDQNQSSYVTTLKATKTLYGKKIYINSGSDNGIGWPLFNSGDFISFSNTIGSSTSFKGHIHEIRLWSGSLNDATLIEHSLSPNTYTYNVDIYALHTGFEAADPYKHLLQRFTLSDDNFKDGNKFYSCHPNQTINNSGSYELGYIEVSDTNNFVLEGFEETYYTPSPSLGGSSLYTNKVRIESSSLDVNKRLNTKTRIEKSSYDRYSLDSNKVGVYFSPQTQINNDIFNQLGYFEIDDYIGDPGDAYKEKYPALINFATQYWKKYENRNDFEAYFRALEIYDFTLFKYIKQLLPYRANPILGLVVEPNVLERSRVRLNQKPIIEDLTQFADIDVESKLPMHLEIENIDALIDNKQRPNLEYDANKLAELTYAQIKPNLEYDDNRLAELTYAQIKPNLEYDSNKLAEFNSETTTTTNFEYDDNRLAEFNSETTTTTNFEYDDNRLGEFDSEIHATTNFEYDVDKLSNINTVPDFNSAIIDISNAAIVTQNFKIAPVDIINNEYGILKNNNPKKFEVKTIASNQGSITADNIFSIISNKSIVLNSTIDTDVYNVDKLGTSWSQTRNIGMYRLSESGSFEAQQPIVLESRKSSWSYISNYFYSSELSASLKLPYSQSYVPSDIRRNRGTGWQNARYAGSKLTGPGVNINTPTTVDGGPVVKVTNVNPNQIVIRTGEVIVE